MDILEGVIVSEQKVIFHPQGNIMHAMKQSAPGYVGFGEAYFSGIKYNEIKGWKCHTKMTLNIVVPIGEILFVMYDDREESKTFKKHFYIKLGRENYKRLTVPPMIWMAFKGIGENENMLLNILDFEHDPNEAIGKPLEQFVFPWDKIY